MSRSFLFYLWKKCNLDRTDCKKVDEEKQCYRLIPRTFVNWLQAFANLASVIGKKTPENFSVLFWYMDSIGEAYKAYGGFQGLGMTNNSDNSMA